ncbi:hypothetical protein N7450_011617 [Penicillium hetheringtonii]|uniref:Uncharacterized protein n=1 Tax=Penicillium hetheringtonii TaxID=911720 RepID=A0AAD6DAK0_9EURO|nr:hypothetical protein N7450_011617 [Penicillium hetheringtonii]
MNDHASPSLPSTPKPRTQADSSNGNHLLSWLRQQKYKIAGATFATNMIGSFILVGRNPYLTGKQKICTGPCICARLGACCHRLVGRV